MINRNRYAIITPYFKEERRVLERCINSVRTQTLAADHFVVADGHPQGWLDGQSIRHLKLDRSHSDFGNTPRGVGALLAMAEGYAGVGFLDADNWLEPYHIASCVEASRRRADCDYVIAQRNLCRPDGSVMPIGEGSDLIDTNCLFLLPGSYHVIPHFSLIPLEMASIGDRIFTLALKDRKLNSETVQRRTVNYLNLWAVSYETLGEDPPPNAKRTNDIGTLKNWLDAQTPREREIVDRRCGIQVIWRPAAPA
jgi:glycosyltransferase involved in cell wall biosynthesis